MKETFNFLNLNKNQLFNVHFNLRKNKSVKKEQISLQNVNYLFIKKNKNTYKQGQSC